MARKVHRAPSAPGRMAGRVPQVMQMEALECGAACLAMVCAYYGKWIALEQVRADCGVSRDGSSALNVVKAARSYGLDARGFRYEPESLREHGVFPCIAHMDFAHFVVVRGFKGAKVYVNDPASGETALSLAEFDKRFTGVALQFAPTDAFEPGGRPASIKEFAVERLRGARAALAFVAVSSAVSAVMGVINPVMSQVFMDRLLTGKNLSWTAPFLALLAAFGLIRVVMGALSAIYLKRVEGKMAASANSAFLWKLLHLPMEFYSQRLVGDISQRMSSNSSIAQRLAGQLAPLLIDAAMLVVYLVLMMGYSPLLASVGLASMAVDVAVARLVSAKRVNATRVMMRDSANLSSATMAGISLIETIKAQGVEPSFFARWSGYQASVNKTNVALSRLGQSLGLIPSIVSVLCDNAVLGLGVWLIIGGQFTAGALMAVQSLVQQFASPAQRLISVMQMLQEMRVDMERVKDVMDYPEDPLAAAGAQGGKKTAADGGAQGGKKTAADDGAAAGAGADGDADADAPYEKLLGELELDHVTFGYSRLADPVVKDFSLHVRPGGCVALVGPSGCGKSTISKLVAGLYEPWSGEVRVDGVPLARIPRPVRTGSIAVIDQDVVLYHDTIGNNIRLWDSTIEDYEVVLAARDAQIHDVIARREGAYDSVLAENGRDLSGGQRQRLEIARALAMDPTVLVMDEATSALDAQTEAEVMKAVRKRGITLLIVAHRLSTIRDADEIVVFEKGEVAERGTHEELYAHDGAYRRLVSQE